MRHPFSQWYEIAFWMTLTSIAAYMWIGGFHG